MTLRPLVASLLALSLVASAQGLPDLGDASTSSLSESQERTIAAYVKALGARLLLAAEGPRRNLEFFVINDEQINAFALVGGHIGVYSGLIALTQTESELAGVLAHEISHITQRHQARAMHGQRGTQLASLAALALAILASSKGSGGGQSAQVTEAAIMGASAMAAQAQLDYTRDHEREADRVGLTLLDRSGLDTRAMVTFFERLLRANRLNEFKGAPSYLRTHPLTTERIADMQDRVERLPTRMVPDSFDYRLARAKIRAMAGAPQEAVFYFTTQLADKTVLRPREDVYGLAYSQRRARDLDAAWKTLAPLRENVTSNPSFELLAAQIRADQGRVDDAMTIYRAALKANVQSRALVYGYLDLLVQRGRSKEALADLEERLRYVNDDPRLYELQARAFDASGERLAQHRAQAEAYYRRGNLASAVDQLEIAVKFRNANFYDLSSAESRLREMRVLLENERAAEKAMKLT